MGDELVGFAVLLAICVALAAALLRFVPPKSSRTWATGLLVFVMFCNLGPVIGVVVAQFSPPCCYLETEKNRLEFNRDRGEKCSGSVSTARRRSASPTSNWARGLGRSHLPPSPPP
jgi:hypothetical protein